MRETGPRAPERKTFDGGAGTGGGNGATAGSDAIPTRDESFRGLQRVVQLPDAGEKDRNGRQTRDADALVMACHSAEVEDSSVRSTTRAVGSCVPSTGDCVDGSPAAGDGSGRTVRILCSGAWDSRRPLPAGAGREWGLTATRCVCSAPPLREIPGGEMGETCAGKRSGRCNRRVQCRRARVVRQLLGACEEGQAGMMSLSAAKTRRPSSRAMAHRRVGAQVRPSSPGGRRESA